MFASVRAQFRTRRVRPGRPRLSVQPLEGRDVPATVADPLATFAGTVDAPHAPGWVQMEVGTPSRVLLAFESEPSAGSAFEPGPLRVFAGEGSQARGVGPAGGHGFALRTVGPGIHFARAAGARGTTGAFDVSVRLAGDVNGDHRVDAQDLDAIRGLRGARAGQAAYVPAADVNHNGLIGPGDLQLAQWNLGRSANVGPVTADRFLFANNAPLAAQFDPRTMSGISLVIAGINDSKSPIDADSFSWGVTNPSGGSLAKSDLAVSAATSPASPLLFQATVNGTIFDSATLFAGRAGRSRSAKPRLEWDMTNVQVTSYSISGTQGNGTHLEDVFSLNFTKLTVTYTPIQPDGRLGTPVSATFDFNPPS